MGLLDGMMGHAAEVGVAEVQKEFAEILADGEQIERAYKLIRDAFVFTNKRLILLDKQGLSGKKAEYHSIPYRSITHFSVETAGTFDLDAELKIWISGNPVPIEKEFKKDKSIFDIQKQLANYVLR
jgi:hypothetical protein